MQQLSTTLHDKICMQANVCREKSWKVDAIKKLCYATTKHDFTRQETYAGRLMSWKVVKSRCNKKLCYATTKHDFTRQKYMQVDLCREKSWKVDATKSCVMQRQNTTLHDKKRMQVDLCREKSWKVVKSRCNKKTMLCNDKARLCTTRYVCRQTYVVKSREK